MRKMRPALVLILLLAIFSLSLFGFGLSLVHAKNPTMYSSPVTVTTTTDSAHAGFYHPLKSQSFYSLGRYWVFFLANVPNCEFSGSGANCLEYTSSSDGTAWASPTNLNVNIANFTAGSNQDIGYSVYSQSPNVYYARYNFTCNSCSSVKFNNILFRQGTVKTDGSIVWAAESQIGNREVATGTQYQYGIKTVISSIGTAFVTMTGNFSGGTCPSLKLCIFTSSDYAIWTSSLQVNANSGADEALLAPMLGGKVYALTTDPSPAGGGYLFDGSIWGSEETIGAQWNAGSGGWAELFAQGDSLTAIYQTGGAAGNLLWINQRPSGSWGTERGGLVVSPLCTFTAGNPPCWTASYDQAQILYHVFYYDKTNRQILDYSGTYKDSGAIGLGWPNTVIATTGAANTLNAITSDLQSILYQGNYQLGIYWTESTASPWTIKMMTGTYTLGPGPGNIPSPRPPFQSVSGPGGLPIPPQLADQGVIGFMFFLAAGIAILSIDIGPRKKKMDERARLG